MLDWSSTENHLLLNPRLPQADRLRVETAWKKWSSRIQGHVGLLTSGSTGDRGKIVLLSKLALLKSAAAVNQHLRSSRSDVWLKTLPDFHVGGLGIYVRASLSGAKVFNDFGEIGSWNPQTFVKRCQEVQASLVSLVPSQVFDLVTAGLRAPLSLRAIVVGGGACGPDLFDAAIGLGWPVLASYGLSECCSQVATATHPSLQLELLSHIQAELSSERKLRIKSESLLTAYLFLEVVGGSWIDPKKEGWLLTEDEVEIDGQTLRMIGRGQDFIKIGGESVSLSRLEAYLESLRIELRLNWDLALLAVPDVRLGHAIELLVSNSASEAELSLLRNKFTAQVLPFERIRRIHRVSKIPRSPLGKLLRVPALKLAQP